MDSAGKLVIVPAYGPDADEIPYKTLSTADVVAQTTGEPSIGTVINKAVVSSSGYQRSDAVEVMQPAWFQVGAQALFGQSGAWYEPPNDRVNLQAPTEPGADILQEDVFDTSDSFLAQTPAVWPVSPDNTPAGFGISLVDGSDSPLVTVGWARYQGFRGFQTLHSSGTTGLTLLENEVPFDGVWRPTLLWEGSAGLFNFSLTINASWQKERNAVAFAIGSATLDRHTGSNVYDSFVVEFTLNDESSGYAEGSGVTATFGTLAADEEEIPTGEGGNAVADSQTAFGVQEVRVDVRGYVLSAEQALAMAQGIVLANLTPRAIRSLDLGWRGSTVPLFDDRGRLFGTPNGGEGLLVGVQYDDDFISVTGGKRVRVEETLAGQPGSIPTTLVWLLNDDGSFWTNDDNSTSEVA
jgi:hypothetical protein